MVGNSALCFFCFGVLVDKKRVHFSQTIIFHFQTLFFHLFFILYTFFVQDGVIFISYERRREKVSISPCHTK